MSKEVLKFEFEINVPNACIDCQFHTIDKNDLYGNWYVRCLIDKNIKTTVKDSIKQRNEDCPGIVCDPDYLPGAYGDP